MRPPPPRPPPPAPAVHPILRPKKEAPLGSRMLPRATGGFWALFWGPNPSKKSKRSLLDQRERVFVHDCRRQGCVSGFPEKGADLRGSPGNFRGSPGNFRGSPGNFRGTSGLLFSSTVRELPGKLPKTSGEVWGTSGEVRGLSRSSGEPDSLPVTRQICLQIVEPGDTVGAVFDLLIERGFQEDF